MHRLTREQRTSELHHHIDPGFINRRRCFSTFGRPLIELFDQHRKPGDDQWTHLSNDHLLVDLVLRICKGSQVPTLGEALHELMPSKVFTSTEELKGIDDIDEKPRVRNRILLPYKYERNVWLEFSTEHFVAATGRVEQTGRYKVSIVGIIRHFDDREVVVYPLIMGAPAFDHPWNQDSGIDSAVLMWMAWNLYETFPEDIDQFAQISNEPDPSTDIWQQYMRKLPEAEVKKRFCEILGESSRADWGGEQADHFSASVSLNGRRTTAAFLLKGPAGFREMTPEMLGRRADQIYRLACTPARFLVVQHSHQIGEAVRATLRAFAVAPHDPRHYCLIDGKDTYKILKVYGKL